MTFSTGNIRDLVAANLGSHGTPDRTGGIQNPELDRLIAGAGKIYSNISPDSEVHDGTGDGSAYDMVLPSDWDDSFSTILSVEYPQGNRIPTFLSMEEVTIYKKDTGNVIRFLSTTPTDGSTVRVLYTRPHVIGEDSSDTTVPDADMDAIGHLVTHLAALRLAAEMAKVVPSALRDDPLGLRSSVGEYERLARRHWTLFANHMGIPADNVSIVRAASHSVKLVNNMSWGGQPFSNDGRASRLYNRG